MHDTTSEKKPTATVFDEKPAHHYSACVQNIHRLIAIKFLNNLHFTLPVFVLFLANVGLSFTHVMLLEVIFLTASMLAEIPTGMLGDKIGRKWSIVCGQILHLLAWIPWFFADGFGLFALSFLMNGIAMAFESGSDMALIYDDLKEQKKEKDMQKIAGRYHAAMTLGMAIAALVTGFVAVTLDPGIFYLLSSFAAAGQLIGLFLLLSVRDPKRTAEASAKEHAAERSFHLFTSGIRHLRTHRKTRKIFFLYLFTMPFSFVLLLAFQPYFQLSQVPLPWYGFAVFLSSLLAGCAKLFAYKIERRLGVERGTFFITVLPGLLWAGMAAVLHPVGSVFLFILNDTVGNVRDPIFADYMNRHIESANRATVLSTVSLAASLYVIPMRLLAGFAVDFDVRLAFLVLAAIILMGAVAFRITESDVTK